MALYYFDMRDDEQFYPDNQGTELDGELAAARIVAFSTLTNYLNGRAPETDSPRRVAVEVSDGNHKPLMAAVVTVELVPAPTASRPVSGTRGHCSASLYHFGKQGGRLYGGVTRPDR
jgi:hypothetical protein